MNKYLSSSRLTDIKKTDMKRKFREVIKKRSESPRLPVVVEDNPAGTMYELVFRTGDYFPVAVIAQGSHHNMQSVVVRISLPDPDARYHIPVVLSPHSYTVWWSG